MKKRDYLLILGGIISIELLSFLAYFFPTIQIFALALIFLSVLFFSLKKLESGLLIAVVELVIGSKGHLFSLNIFDFTLSLRMAIFSAVMLAYLYQLFKSKKLINIPFKKHYLALFLFILLGLLLALLNNFDLRNIYSDFNAYLFFLYIFPIAFVYQKTKRFDKLIKIFFLSAFWLALKTLILLFIFSNNFAFISDLYLWLRRSGIAEITTFTGQWPRIFLQSHIYALSAFLFLIVPSEKKIARYNLPKIAINSIFLSVIVISFSRSLWLALALTILLASPFIIYRLKTKLNWFLELFLTMLGSLLIIIAINNISISTKTSDFSLNLISKRANIGQEEAALSSRWSLLPAMLTEIQKKPILGYGFGKTISYQSSDPRVLENNEEGWYETFAFEWGYLDFWLKIGLGGLLSYLFLLFILIKKAYLKNYLNLAVVILALSIVHIFTPYLNHPLGIVVILFSSCFLFKDRL